MSQDELSGPDLAGVIADANAAGLEHVVIGGSTVAAAGGHPWGLADRADPRSRFVETRDPSRMSGDCRPSANQQVADRDADRLGEGLDGGDAGVSLARLDPRHLGRVDAAAFRHGLLGQAFALTRLPEVLSERTSNVAPARIAAHDRDRLL